MKLQLRSILGALILTLFFQTSFSQVIDPADPVIEYTGGRLNQPVAGQIADWVKTTRLVWNTEDYRCYIYKGNIFRIKFPKTYQHNVNDGKTYPLFIFFHGLGESGNENIYDNEYQLFHGGERHKDSVNSGAFDGFLMYPQNQYGFYGNANYDAYAEVIQNFMVSQNKVDINRIYVNGLSAGGAACWEFSVRYPNLVAAILPISASYPLTTAQANSIKFTPIWQFQGGLDKNPDLASSTSRGAILNTLGANYKFTVYPTRGHSCWNDAWNDKDFHPYMLRAHKANPVALFGKYEFCPGEAINVTIGVTAGFTAYEWRKDGVVIPGATTNQLVVTSFGTYDCRIRRGTTWSPWSPTPIVVKEKAQTTAPVISPKGLQSIVKPSPDGVSSVVLSVPSIYQTYSWRAQGSATVLGTTDSLVVSNTGNYIARVVEPFGCNTAESAPFTVINANGPNKPDAPSNLIANALSLTQIKLDWSDNPSPANNETNFEVYRATQAGGPYTLIGITGQDVTTFTASGLTQGTRYYFMVRSHNATAASANSAEVSAVATPDSQAPTAPGNLHITSSTTNYVGLAWNASTDNVGIFKYDIYVNGVLSFVTSNTFFNVNNLNNIDGGYMFVVKARDAAGNVSGASNQIFGIPPAGSPAAPESPTGITATAVSYKQINISWTDASTTETGFEILRSTNPIGKYSIVGTVGANVTSFADSIGLSASTTYYYRVRSVYLYGGSDLRKEPEASWKFNNSLSDASGNNKGLVNVGGLYDAADKVEGSHSISFNGTNQYVDITGATNDYLRGGYTAKSVSFWMKSNDNTGNRIVMDLGGSDDGLVVRLDANILYAGIASNNVRRTISTAYTSTSWNHIALVYHVNQFQLFINGALVASNNAVGFNAVGTTTNNSRLGGTNGTNSFNLTTGIGLFNGYLDNVEIFDNALSATDISQIINNTLLQANATTSSLPALPTAPGSLVATAASSSEIGLTWSDNSANETGFRVYKSDDNNSNFALIATLPANTTSYSDANLFANATRFYKVTSFNVIGESAASNEASAQTLQPFPVVAAISNKVMRFGTQLQVNVQATSPLNSPIVLSVQNLPSFATFTPGANGAGVISFTNPAEAQQGTYAGIIVTATDSYGNGSTQFDLVVNDNYDPVIDPISNVALDEKQTTQATLTANDINPSDVLSWSFTGLPSFVTVTPSGNNVVLNYAPGYADHGTYNVTATVVDGTTGVATRNFSIVITDVYPTKRIYLNFTDGSIATPSPWNATNKTPSFNDNFANLKDEFGITTPVGLRILTPWANIGNGSNVLGVNTGNNSGVYPDAVIRTAYWTDASVQNMSIYGLDTSRKYTVTFFGSRGGVNDNRTSVYTLQGTSVSLNAASNSQNTVKVQGAVPSADGTMALSLSRGAGASFGYLNALVIEEVFDDSSAPAKPRNIAAQLNNTTASLTWIDAAYNETSYQVYRSTSANGAYTLLNPAGNNSNLQSYADATLVGSQSYYYYVVAVNGYGSSPSSDTVSVTTGNRAPVLAAITNGNMRIQETVDVAITATDDPGNTVVLTASNLPSFATLVDNGNGTGYIRFIPGNSIGIYNNIVVTATDNNGAVATRTFRMLVRDVFNSIYVNFSNDASVVGASPWNNFNSVPFAGKSLVNMIDDSEMPTTVSITQVDTWEGANLQGATTGNNSGIFPDNVIRSVYYNSTATPMRLRIAGLNTVNTKYNIVFFASRAAGDDRSTTYTANGQSVTLNAANNVYNTVQINGLVPDANGEIEFNAIKAGASPYAYLGAVVIQSYFDDGTPFAPSNLQAVALSKSKISLKWLDKSSDEDGFEVYRAEAYDGPYTLLQTTGASVSSYIDSVGLAAGKVYFYKVRGKKGALYSGYTNIENTSTFMYSVFINFNRQNNAAAPWNNTARAPESGRVFPNLINDLNNPSGLDMTVMANFSGDNPSGMITGNNSGVWPDNVLRSSWWVDIGVSSSVKISNLNQNMYYTFQFTGSRNGGGDRTCVYTINGKSVSLNASFNINNIVQIDGVKPDANGEVLVTVSLGQYAAYAYLNGMAIHGYKKSANTGSGSGIVSAPVVGLAEVVNGTQAANLLETKPTVDAAEVNGQGVYPNPFRDHVVLNMSIPADNQKVSVQVYDLKGNLMVAREYEGVNKGVWSQRLELPVTKFIPGVYILKMATADGQVPPKVFKIVKNR